jgi:hypothetical protein
MLRARCSVGLRVLVCTSTPYACVRAGAPDQKLPLLERVESSSALCVVTMSRLLGSLHRGLAAPPPPIFAHTIEQLGVGLFAGGATTPLKPPPHVSPRAAFFAPPPAPTALPLSAPLVAALELIAQRRQAAVPLLDDAQRPVEVLAAADVPALVHAAAALSPVTPPSSLPNVGSVMISAAAGGSGSGTNTPLTASTGGARTALRGGLLEVACSAALALIPSRCGRVLTCTRRTTLLEVCDCAWRCV